MANQKMEKADATWLALLMESDERDAELLSAFRSWMQARVGRDDQCLMLQEVVETFERLYREKRFH